MKMLFTSVGRRVELMQAFRKAADELKTSGGLQDDLTIIGADITDTALYFCDETRIVPRIKGESYIPVLLEICQEEAVNCLIPTMDTDLLLTENKQRFESIGAKVLIKEYVHSGYKAVAEIIPQIDDAEEKLWKAFEEKKPAIDTVLKDEGIYSDELKARCLGIYRDHKPDIHLYDGVAEMLKEIHK